MSAVSSLSPLSDEDKDFLEPFLPAAQRALHQRGGFAGEDLPWVTLTYASSLDGMISLAPGTRTTLSGPETKSMTHYLRSHHDAILIGVGTAVADDPSLNCRYPNATTAQQPTPVIVDPDRRLVFEDTKLHSLASTGQGKRPLLIHSAKPPYDPEGRVEDEYCDHETLLGQDGDPSRDIPWRTLLRKLRILGFNSVMIEGGATVIRDLMYESLLVNSVIVTIAPTWLGQGSVNIAPHARTAETGERVNAARLHTTAWRQLGQDAVLCGRFWTREPRGTMVP